MADGFSRHCKCNPIQYRKYSHLQPISNKSILKTINSVKKTGKSHVCFLLTPNDDSYSDSEEQFKKEKIAKRSGFGPQKAKRSGPM